MWDEALAEELRLFSCTSCVRANFVLQQNYWRDLAEKSMCRASRNGRRLETTLVTDWKSLCQRRGRVGAAEEIRFTMCSGAFASSPSIAINRRHQFVLNSSPQRRPWQPRILMSARPVWERVAGCDVLIPLGVATPRAVIHFAGGLGAGAAPRALYGTFLEGVVERGEVAVVATPVGSGFDHDRLATEVATMSSTVLDVLKSRWGVAWIPVVGLCRTLSLSIRRALARSLY